MQSYRVGSVLILEADDGDVGKHNSSMVLDGRGNLQVHDREGIHVGGAPRYQSGAVLKINDDFRAGNL